MSDTKTANDNLARQLALGAYHQSTPEAAIAMLSDAIRLVKTWATQIIPVDDEYRVKVAPGSDPILEYRPDQEAEWKEDNDSYDSYTVALFIVDAIQHERGNCG